MPLDQPIERVGELLFAPRHRHAVPEDILVHRRFGTLDAVEQHSELQRSRGERILGVVQRRAVDQGKQCERLRDALRLRRRPRTRLGQFGDRGSGEQFLDIESDATLLCLATHGEGKHRVSANGEEIVVYTNGFHAEHRGEHIDQRRLGRSTRGDGRSIRRAGPGQRPTVHLAARREGERVQFDEAGGNHVRGQPLCQVIAELIDGDELSDEITDQVGAVGVRRLGYHDRRSHTRARLHRGLDLAEAHPIAADLDFIVDAAQKLEVAVRSPAGEVARSVTSAARHALVGDERGRGQIVTAAIAAGQTHPADVQFTGHAHRTAVSALVENQQCRVVDRFSDRDRIHRPGRRAVEVAHVHRRLGRPVEIHQPRHADGAEYPVEPLDQRRRKRFPTAEHRVQ